jgi:hypothetical protein
MCFSANASIVAGLVLSSIGALTLKEIHQLKTSERSAALALAVIPCLFAMQQFIEAVVWQSIEWEMPRLQAWVTHLYLLFSHVLWPVYVPLAIWLIEPSSLRRPWLMAFVVIGSTVSAYLLYYLIAFPVVSHPTGHHIEYVSPHFLSIWVMGAYLIATTISAMCSTHRMIRYFGVLSLVSFAAVYYFYAVWFISVWCFFAAGLSILIYLHFALQRTSEKQEEKSCLLF